MNFDEKLSSLLSHLKNRISPVNISPTYLRHYICDFIELYSMLNKEKVTKSEIIDLFNDSGFDLAKVDRESISKLSQTEIDEKKESEINLIFECLSYRMNIIENKYPFMVNLNNDSVTLRTNLTFEQKVYSVLLLASNLSIFSEFQSILTSDFEYLVYCASINFFPSQAIIKQFGKNSNYSGNAQSKIRALANDLNIETRDKEIEKVTGSQEKGLDLIAWIPFDDQDTNMLIYLFQCACGDGWIKKFSETKRYLAYFDFYKLQPQSIMVASYAFNMMGEFEKSDDMVSGESLFFDRLRVMKYIEINPNKCTSQESLQSIKLIDKLIETQNISLNI